MNKLMKSLCGTLWIALMCPSCDSAESYDPPIDLQKSCVVERIGDALYVSSGRMWLAIKMLSSERAAGYLAAIYSGVR